MAKTGVINARVEQSVRDRLEQYCKDNQIKMAVIVEMALSEWLDKNLHTSVEHNTTQCTQSSETQTQQELEARLSKIEATLGKIDEEGLTALLTAGNDIEHGNSLAQENQKDISDLNHYLDEVVEARLTKLEENKADRAYLAGVSCQLPETPPSELPPEGKKQDKPYQLSINEETANEEAKIDQSENEAQKADNEGLTATELAGILDIPKGYISNWKKGKNIPSAKSKYRSAYQEWLKWQQKGEKWYKKTTS